MQTIKRAQPRGASARPLTYLSYLKVGSRETSMIDCIKCNIAQVISLMASRRLEPIFDDLEELILKWEKLPHERQIRIFALTSDLSNRISASMSNPDQRPEMLLEYLAAL